MSRRLPDPCDECLVAILRIAFGSAAALTPRTPASADTADASTALVTTSDSVMNKRRVILVPPDRAYASS